MMMSRLSCVLSMAVVLCAPTIGRGHGPVETIVVGSTADGGGALATLFHFDGRDARLSYSTTIGPYSIYTGQLPAFESLDADDPPEIYVLDAGTPVSIEITDIQGPVHVVVNSTTLDDVGDSALIGTEPIGHTHPDWRLVLEAPAGTFGEGSISFRLTTTSASYTSSPIYTVKLTNGPLPPPDYDSAEYDQDDVKCRKTVSKAAQKFLAKKLTLARKCLDKIQVLEAHEALAVPPPLARMNRIEEAAEAACVGKPGQDPAKTMLGKIDAARAEAAAAVTSKCASLSSEDIDQNLGFVACQADRLLAASYPDAKSTMHEFTAPLLLGGLPLDRYFPCLHLMLAE